MKTILVRGTGYDTIEPGVGTSVIIVNKTSGSIYLGISSNDVLNTAYQSKRIVYEGDALTPKGILSSGKVVLSGGEGYHDVLSMTKNHPISLPSGSRERIMVLLPDYRPSTDRGVKYYLNATKDVADQLFSNTRCTVDTSTDPPVFCPEADQSKKIHYENIERFELCKNTSNLLLLPILRFSKKNVTHEIIGGPFDDYIINAVFEYSNIPGH